MNPAPQGSTSRVLAALVAVAVVGVAAPSLAAVTTPSTLAAASDTSGAPTASVGPALAGVTGPVRVVVQGHGSPEQAGAAVAAVGGTITRELPVVDGVAATLPAGAPARLAAQPGVRAVSLDRPLHVQGAAAPTTAGVDSSASTTSTKAARTSRYHKATRVSGLRTAGIDGRGATVALLDTGVADVPPLRARTVTVATNELGATARCKNLSGEASCGDSFGHGTFMAGIIAGEPTAQEPAGGVAPGARLVSVKVAGRDGATDVSTVLAGIQWVVSFRERYGIDVLNLSLGTDSSEPYRDDPLNYAVERAWASDVVVVVSAGNVGPSPRTVMKPADDPFVITVGAVDDRGTRGRGDDRLPNFSARGPTHEGIAKPDVVAPGAHLSSLRAPGSLIDTAFPVASDSPYRRGSGTSMSAAVVSGVAALLRSQRDASPDEVKHALTATARGVATDDRFAVGAGLVDARAAVLDAPPGAANGGVARSRGLGSLAASRGSLQVSPRTAPDAVLTGRTTAQLLLWDPVGYTTGRWSPLTWYTSAHELTAWQDVSWAGGWTGENWGGENWGGDNWGGENWGGSSWQGTRDDTDTYGSPGPAPAWYGAWD